MTAKILDGRALAEAQNVSLSQRVSIFKSTYDRAPSLHVILVGDHRPSQIYVRNKARACDKVGIKFTLHHLAEIISQTTLINKINTLNDSADVDGILVQLPLPRHMNKNDVIQSINHDKDVDGLHPLNMGLLLAGRPNMVPCTALGCLKLIHNHINNLTGANALIIGRSPLVGKPTAILLTNNNATVTVAHSRTSNIPELCKTADILVVAIGQAEFIKGNWIKPGATVIDVGINSIEQGNKLVGDVEFDQAATVAGAITPVPGGVGPMTINSLLFNTLKAAENNFD